MARAADPMKKVIKATLELAEKQGWAETSLSDISARAKVPLGDLRGLVRDKVQILEKFQEQIDVETLNTLDPELAKEAPRDRLFEVIMHRFEVLAPHKPALRRIVADLKQSALEQLCLIGPGIRSMDWMVAAAGTETQGFKGALQVNGLAWIYASVLQTWLDDDDPGLAKTMAALDRKLSRGETWLNNAQAPIGLARAFGSFVSSFRKARRDAAAERDSDPAPSAS